MNITDFVGQLGPNGIARTNRYSVVLEPPSSISSFFTQNIRKILMFCDSVNLPGLNLNTTPIRTYGEVREFPYEFNFDNITMTFYVDGEMLVKGFFDNWIKSIQQGDRRTFNYYNDYICGQMQINVEDIANKSPYTVTLYEVYPKTISTIQMGYEQKDIMKLQVTFMFKNWKSEVRPLSFNDDQLGQNPSPVKEMEATRYMPTGWELADSGKFGTDFSPSKIGFNSLQEKYNDLFAEIGGGSTDTGITDTNESYGRYTDYA